MKNFTRLLGQETEYALLRVDAANSGHRAGRVLFRDFLESLFSNLRQKLPIARGDPTYTLKPAIFLANGSALYFETTNLASGEGLLEGATPECRSPRDVLIWQRTQDEMLSDAMAETSHTMGEEIRLLKNCRDPKGSTYGANESYEVEFASGWRWWVWTVGMLVGIIPLTLLNLAANILLLAIILLNLIFIAPIVYYLYLPEDLTQRKRWKTLCFGRLISENDTQRPEYTAADAAWSYWLDWLLVHVISRSLVSCMTLYTGLFFTFTTMKQTQRKLLGFLISRMVLGGAGRWEEKTGFHLTEKADSRRTEYPLLYFNSLYGIFSLGSLNKPLLVAPVWLPRLLELFRTRNRMQVNIGDSNMCEVAEYLRIATTWLCVEVAENGGFDHLPLLSSPFAALRKWDKDPSLSEKVRLTNNHWVNIVEAQRMYLEACRTYFQKLQEVPDEVESILLLWEATLDTLVRDPQSLLGHLDWVTKKYLLDEVATDAPYATRKKIDLKYHELSPEGYYYQLAQTGMMLGLVTKQEKELASRNGPGNTPASARGSYIREHSGSGEIFVFWNRIRHGSGSRKTIKFTDDQHLPG